MITLSNLQEIAPLIFNNSITINHNCIQFNQGFFLVGFDYKLSTGERINKACQKGDYEYFNPKENELTYKIVWLK